MKEEILEEDKEKAHELIIYEAHELFTIRVKKINDDSCIKFIKSKNIKMRFFVCLSRNLYKVFNDQVVEYT